MYQPDTRNSRYNFAVQESGGESSYVLENRWRAQDSFDTSSHDDVGDSYPLVNMEVGKYEVHGTAQQRRGGTSQQKTII